MPYDERLAARVRRVIGRRDVVEKRMFGGLTLKGFVYVAPEGTATDGALRGWVRRAVRFVASLPPR